LGLPVRSRQANQSRSDEVSRNFDVAVRRLEIRANAVCRIEQLARNRWLDAPKR
jgi:hypothetical protein